MLGLLGSLLAFIIVFGILILVHECGHFFAAKFFKVRVEEFGIGLPPKAKTLFKKGNTEYTLNYLPIGGFVRLYGESDPEGKLQKKHDSFSAQKVWKRMIIAAAGVGMNFLLAYVLIALSFAFGMKPLSILPDDKIPFQAKNSYIIASSSFAEEQGLLKINPAYNSDSILLANIQPGSAAEKAGVTSGMKIARIEGKSWKNFEEFYAHMKAVKTGEKMIFTFTTPTGTEKKITLEKPDGPFGFAFAPQVKYLSAQTGKPLTSLDEIPTYSIPWQQIPVVAAQELGTITMYTIEGLGVLASSIVQSFTIPKEIGGPVQIAEVVHNVNMNAGIPALILLMIILSVNLGVINILPIPALDGGRIFFMICELFGLKPNSRFEANMHIIGYGLLMLLLLVITAKDILRIIFPS